MENRITVAVDAMGGDNAPFEIIKGAVEAVKERENVSVLLTGQEAIIKKELEAYDYPKERIAILPASQVIETGEPPVAAIKGTVECFDQEAMAGMAGASEDGAYLWQIGINVVPECAGKGLAAELVRSLKNEIIRRGKVPFYGTSESHTISQTVALKAGFVPAWTEIYVCRRKEGG